MKAARYKIETCLVDAEDTVHVLLVSKKKKSFVPLYLDMQQSETLLRYFSGEETEEDKYNIMFMNDSWQKLGFQVKSIVIDHQGSSSLLVPTITLLQNQMDQRYIYITLFVPINIAILLSASLDAPLYLTNRAENVVKNIDLDNLQKYIKEIGTNSEEGDENEEGN